MVVGFICLPLLFICWWSACGRVPGWLVSHFLSFSALVLGFPAGLSPTSLNPLPCICLPFPFICLPLLLSPMFVTANFCPFPLAMQHFYSCPRSVTAGVRPSPFAGLSLVCPCVLAMKHFYSFVCQVRHCWCHVAFIFPGPLLLLSFVPQTVYC